MKDKPWYIRIFTRPIYWRSNMLQSKPTHELSIIDGTLTPIRE